MRILHAISGIDPGNGGPTIALLGLTRAQVQAGLDVSVVATWHETVGKPLPDAFEIGGVKVHQIGPARGALSRHSAITATLERLITQCDVLHIHAMWEEIQHQAARVAQRHRVPYLITPHGMLSPWNLSRGRWRKRLYMALRARTNLDRAAAIHFTCQTESELAAPLRIKAKALIETLGVDLSEFETLPARGAFRRRFPALGTRPVVLFLGRFDYKKGLDVLIPAFALAHAKDAMLVLAGPDSGYLRQAQRLVGVHGLEDRVIFTGMLHGAERIEALVDADLFALTSYQENFGIAVIESLAAGTPVLISDQVNIHKELAAARVGVVVPVDVSAAAREMAHWLNNPVLRAEASRAARPYVWAHHDWIAIARRWEGHYRKLCGDGNVR